MWRKHKLSSSSIDQNTSLIIIFFVLIVFGLIMLTLTTTVISYNKYSGDNFYFLKHQLLFGLLPGLFLFFLCAKIPYKFWQKNAGLVFLIAIVLLVLVFVPTIGYEGNKAKSWIKINESIRFQPSEIAKLALIIYLAAWFSKHKEHVKSFFHGLLPFLILVGIIASLVALQPDIGTMSIIVLIAFGIYFVAGLKWSHFFGLILTGSGLFFLLVKIIKIDPDGRHLERILTFLNPSTNLQGAGYHISQALIAVGSGGLFGRGLGGSRQIFGYLPEVIGDSIFAAIAEELGFFLTAVFVIFLFILIFKILHLARASQDNFVKFFAIGVALWIGVQAIVNIGAMIGILPLTGVPLPFVSFGGTALMALMASFGILINMLKR